MATRASRDDVVPLSAADRALEASLNKLKLGTSDYLNDPNNRTGSDLASSCDGHARALNSAGLTEQAGEKRKVEKDFRKAGPSKKQRIAAALGKSLVRMTVNKLRVWSIVGAVTAGGIAYALYKIGQNGQLVEVSDVNMDGLTDLHRIDVNYDGVADYELVDMDFDGKFDQLNQVTDAGGVSEAVTEMAQGSALESVIDWVGNLF